MCSTRKETKRKCKLRGRKTAKSQQTSPFVSLTSCSLMVSVTACCPMKKEKREKRKSCTATVTVCVCRARGLPDLPQPVGETERDQLRPMQKGGGGGGSCREKWSGAAIPCHPGNQRSFKETSANGKHRQLCPDKKSHDCQNTAPYAQGEKGRRGKKEVVGVEGDKEEKNREARTGRGEK